MPRVDPLYYSMVARASHRRVDARREWWLGKVTPCVCTKFEVALLGTLLCGCNLGFLYFRFIATRCCFFVF